MKTAKKLIFGTILLIMLMVIPLSMQASAADDLPTSGQCGENVFWSLDVETGLLTISGEGSMYDYDFGHGSGGKINPWEGDIRVKKVEVVEGVTYIGTSAFCSCAAYDFNIAETVTDIGRYAFCSCKNLKEIHLPENITFLDEFWFYFWEGNEGKVIIPEHIVEIKSYAFWSSLIDTVIVPKNVEIIRENAFSSITSNPRNAYVFNPDCVIEKESLWSYDGGTGVLPENIFIHGYIGSTAQAYAEEHGNTFVALTCADENKECVFGEWQKIEQETCTKNGSEYRVCNRCLSEQTQIVEATKHDYIVVTIDSTCTQEGAKTTTCSKCDYENVETIPATDHFDSDDEDTLCDTCGKELDEKEKMNFWEWLVSLVKFVFSWFFVQIS